jgi:hypothetical protein
MRMVLESVVAARVRRALRRDGESLRKTRPGNTWAEVDFGTYYTVDVHTGFASRRHVDIAALARELRVLRPGEVVKEQSSIDCEQHA